MNVGHCCTGLVGFVVTCNVDVDAYRFKLVTSLERQLVARMFGPQELRQIDWPNSQMNHRLSQDRDCVRRFSAGTPRKVIASRLAPQLLTAIWIGMALRTPSIFSMAER